MKRSRFKKRMSKKNAQRVHSKKRAYQRYGIQFNREDIRNIIEIIQTGKTIM